jgi:hypothetical protein
MISFQPITQVGRTEAGLGGGVGADALWARIAEGLYGDGAAAADLVAHEQWFGHPGCNRFVQGVIVAAPAAAPVFQVLVRADDRRDVAAMDACMRAFGGASLRLDTPLQAAVRVAALAGRHPVVLLRHALPWLWRLARRLDRHPGRLAWRVLRGRARVAYLNIVSHHFMSAEELATPRGRERLDLCTFKVAVGDELVSMCAANALGIRARYYAAGGAAAPARSAALPGAARGGAVAAAPPAG